MAGRDPDHDGGDGDRAPTQRDRPDDPPAVYVCGLEVGLLDVGRVVTLNGYAEACKRLAFVSSAFYLERDLLMATKRVRYGRWQRTRLMGLSRTGDVERVSFLLLKVHAEVDAADAGGRTSPYLASEEGRDVTVRLLLDRGADVGARTTRGWTPLRPRLGSTCRRSKEYPCRPRSSVVERSLRTEHFSLKQRRVDGSIPSVGNTFGGLSWFESPSRGISLRSAVSPRSARSFGSYGVVFIETHRLVCFWGQEEVWMMLDRVAKGENPEEGRWGGRGEGPHLHSGPCGGTHGGQLARVCSGR
jgi:hypothetical protein